jgi:hypothetical protein
MRQPLCWGLMIVAVVVLRQAVRERFLVHLKESPYLIYAGCAIAVAAATIWKVGAGSNYFMEPLLAVMMWIVYVPRSLDIKSRRTAMTVGAIVLVLCCAAEPLAVRPQTYAFTDRKQIATALTYYPQMSRDVEALGFARPLILNPSVHRHAYALGGTPALNDPFHYKLLWSDGILDLATFLKSIDDGAYDIIMVRNDWQSDASLAPVDHRIIAVVLAAYRPGREGFGWTYFVRR